MKPEKVVLENYDSLLKEIKDHVDETQSSIELVMVRKKVEMAWKIGKSISVYLKKNSGSDKNNYGKHLLSKLEQDVGITTAVLYKMHNFYKSYPSMPQNNEKLNWSHYRVLSGVKSHEERKYLEDLVSSKDLSEKELIKAVKKSKTKKSVIQTAKTSLQKLVVRRGKVFCYQIVKPVGADKNYIDCGFKVYREVTEKLPVDAVIVESVQGDASYKLRKSDVTKKQIFTYKAYLKRVVDGDTIHAVLDLGFGLLHEETLRLTGINSAESETESGINATNEIKKILADYDHFVVRTSSTDTYNRYLADIFLPSSNDEDLQKTADSGVYLSQLLLDRGLAEVF